MLHGPRAGLLAAARKLMPRVMSLAPKGEVAELLEKEDVPVDSLGVRATRKLGSAARAVIGLTEHLRKENPALVCSILIHANFLATVAKGITRER